MTNAYFKSLEFGMAEHYKECIISDLQTNLRNSTKLPNEDIYDFVKNSDSQKLQSSQNLDINLLLKYYILQQLLNDKPFENKKDESKENMFENTFNPKIKKHIKENKYYQLVNQELVCADDIFEVKEDGSYIKLEKRKNSSYTLKNIYNSDDVLISTQLISPQGKVVSDKWQVVEILGMRKEFAKKYKYTGFSGNSKDLMADILNNFVAPIETGYYLDKTCKIFKWVEKEKCFIRNLKAESLSPLLIDYEFSKKNIVIKKEYTGIIK